MELSSSNTKKFLISSQKKAFLILQETYFPSALSSLSSQNFSIFRETELCYISGNGTF